MKFFPENALSFHLRPKIDSPFLVKTRKISARLT